MALDNDKLREVYSTLRGGGYEDDYGTFVEGFTGDGNYANRKAVYELLRDNGADVGDTYEEFMGLMQSARRTGSDSGSGDGSARATDGSENSECSENSEGGSGSLVAAAPAPAAQKKGWQPTEQQKIQMGYNMWQMQQQLQQGQRESKAKMDRMMMPVTNEGRRRLDAGRFAAQVAGTPTRVAGFAPSRQNAEGGGRQQVDKPMESGQSPQPYGVVYENGKPKTQWLLPDGTLTTSLIDANQAEHAAREARLAHQFHRRMRENGLDPENAEDVQKQAQLDYEAPLREAVEDEWQRAEAEDRAADEQYRKEYEKAKHGGFLDRLGDALNAPADPNGLPMQSSADLRRDLGRAMQKKRTFDLEKLAQAVYQNMPQSYRDNQILNYSDYFRKHPAELRGRSVAQAAKEALQGEVYRATYDRAVRANMPKSRTEFLMRKIADQPLLSQTIATGMAASALTGSYGMSQAEADAMGRYGEGHRALDIIGTVANMAVDPLTYIGGGVGSAAAEKAMQYAGKAMLKGASKEIAGRYAGRTIAGRMIGGAAGGVGNFATYNTVKDIEQQMQLGGALDPETGKREFDGGEVLKSTLHGVLLGSVTGALSPVIGNVADKWVKATSSTAGKAGVRMGELATSTVAEGTVFATPEWMENFRLADDDPDKRSAMDIWTDNMAMMLGFKASHGIKSAPRVVAGLKPIKEPRTQAERNHNRMNFMERLRKQMDASPRDLDLTQEEREELRKQGYGELADLFKRTPGYQKPKTNAKPKMTDGKTMTFDIVKHNGVEEANAERVTNPEFDSYSAMEALMQDPSVSQSTRAKAYYILTGRLLPMGTVSGYTTETDKHGNIFVKAMTADGEVVTNRRFADEAAAKREQDNIMRQAELNTVDVGERYKETAANIKVVQAAVEQVAPGADFETVVRNYKAVKSGDADAVRNYGEMVKEIDKAIEANKGMADAERPEAIRAAIKEETGVDVDEAIKKGPGKRTEQEQAAVEDYVKRLFPEEKGGETGAEQPMTEDEAEAADIYDRARLTWEGMENGDPEAKADVDDIIIRMQEAYQLCEDAFGTDSEWRMAEMQEDPWAMVNNPELTEDQQDAVLYYIKAKAAMDGVRDASNDAMEAKRKEVAANVERHTHKDSGMVQPATMKVDDKPVYIVKGNVVAFPDGSGIDTANSDQSIVICDAETGEYKFTSPDQIFNVGEAIDPQTELQEAYANIQAEHEAVLGGGSGSGGGNAEERKLLGREAEGGSMSDSQGNPVNAGRPFTEREADELLSRMEDNAEISTEKELTAETWNETFDEDNTIETPIGRVKMGENQIAKFFERNRAKEFGMVGPTLSNPDVIIEEKSEAKDGEAERPSSFLFVKTFNRNGEKIKFFASITVKQDGLEVSISSHYLNKNKVSRTMQEGKVLYIREALLPNSSEWRLAEHQENDVPDLLPTQGNNASDGKGSEKRGIAQVGGGENGQMTALSRIPRDERTGEPVFELADRETALDALNEVTGGNAENTRAIVNAQLEQATKAVEALKKKAPAKKPATLKGSPMQMVKAQQEADAAYNAAMEQYNAQVGAAEESRKAWTRIYTLMNDRIRAVREQQEAKLHDEAVAQAEEQKRIAAEKAAEQAAVGTHAVNPKLKAKWDAATKVEGNANAITLEDGSTLRGHYVLTEAGAATASHDVDNGYEPTEGFPIDENGESVNDRDYKRDRDAQRIVQDIADNYDSRAMQSPVIVSKEGIVLSGNNRTMSGDIAARQNTDKAYTGHLKEFCQMYGFTPEQVESMKHPRVVFVPDEGLSYDASTFARFNAESQKKQSKPEHAVKLGKVVPDNVFNIITGDISRYDRLSDYYADDKAVARAISQLLGAGVINEMQLPELRTGNSLSAAGRELIENTLIGKVFQTSPDAVRQIIAQPPLRQSVVMGLNEIAHNRTLAKSGYDLSGELAAAVGLVSRAKAQSPDIYKEGCLCRHSADRQDCLTTSLATAA